MSPTRTLPSLATPLRSISWRCRLAGAGVVLAGWPGRSGAAEMIFPRPLSTYPASDGVGLITALGDRIALNPFNAVATALFVLAIVHTFLTAKFRHWAHRAEEELARRTVASQSPGTDANDEPTEVSFKGQIFHFLGEVEVVFGIWAAVGLVAIATFFDWKTAVAYVGHQVSFTEPMFVVVVMAIAGTRPVLRLAEQCLQVIAATGGGSTAAWWLSILIFAPILGSFITEPAAMTIAALLLARRFYALQPSPRLAYATLGLLFVNVSVGGTLTHFAAPPVLMVAASWHWDTAYMLTHIGWKAVVGIVGATGVYYAIFRDELAQLGPARGPDPRPAPAPAPAIPAWITAVHVAFLGFTVIVAHFPPLFIGAFLFFLGFQQATAHHQDRLELRGPLLVGFFLAGLVVHGGLQAWWIEPVLRRLGERPLFVGATVLTAFNDNAAITYLATLVPNFTPALQYAVVTGAVTGGGLTVIANAPNPAGQNILQRYFPAGIAPAGLAVAALVPTAIVAACFVLL